MIANRFTIHSVDVKQLTVATRVDPVNEQSKSISSNTASNTSSDFNYVLLPYNSVSYPEYTNHFNEKFGGFRLEEETSESIPFKQIDFDPLRIEFRWCKKVLLVRKCGTETYILQYGPVLSQDVPNDQTTDYFSSIVDLTAYASPLGTNEYSPNGKDYILTSVIVDSERRRLSFLREGVEPWHYGLNPGEVHFVKPVAAKVIAGKLYILDTGDGIVKPSIKVFEVYNTIVPDTDQGDVGLTYIGTIDYTTLNGFELSQVKDVGGFEGETETDPHILLIADRNGLHSVELQFNYFRVYKEQMKDRQPYHLTRRR